jgi:hypothetical protein
MTEKQGREDWGIRSIRDERRAVRTLQRAWPAVQHEAAICPLLHGRLRVRAPVIPTCYDHVIFFIVFSITMYSNMNDNIYDFYLRK